MTDFEIFTQAVGVVGIICSVIAFQCKKHKWILFFHSLHEFIFALQYVLLGAYTGAAINLLNCGRNFLFAHQVEKEKDTRPLIIIFCALAIILGIFTFQGWISILVILAKVLSTVAYGNKSTTFIRIAMLVACSALLAYNLLVSSYAGVLCEGFSLVSVVVGIVRLDLIPLVKRNNSEEK